MRVSPVKIHLADFLNVRKHLDSKPGPQVCVKSMFIALEISGEIFTLRDKRPALSPYRSQLSVAVETPGRPYHRREESLHREHTPTGAREWGATRSCLD